jgi:uncharacterized protein (DUF2132 family)
VTLEQMLRELVEHIGWEAMGKRVRIGCFTSEPSIASSLKLLRKTPWAREKVEAMYLFMLRDKKRRAAAAHLAGHPSQSDLLQHDLKGR